MNEFQGANVNGFLRFTGHPDLQLAGLLLRGYGGRNTVIYEQCSLLQEFHDHFFV